MNKAHSPINWENYPKETTPINEENLNKMDRAIGIIDDRVIEHEHNKLSKTDASSDIVNVEYNKDTSVFKFTKRNGDYVSVDVSSVVVREGYTKEESDNRYANAIKRTYSGETIVATDSSQAKFEGLRVFGRSEQPSTTGKNLLKNVAISQTINGVTLTVNNDGSVTVNGTETSGSSTYIIISDPNTEPDLRDRLLNKSLILSGCPSGGGSSTYDVRLFNANAKNDILLDTGKGIAFTFTNETELFNIAVAVRGNATVNNVTFYPMIRLVSIEDGAYEPYTKQSLSVSTLNGLPAIKVADASLATYTDAEGVMWVADEIDFARGKYVQRIGELNTSDLHWILNQVWTNESETCALAYTLSPTNMRKEEIVSTHFRNFYSGNIKLWQVGQMGVEKDNVLYASIPKELASTSAEFREYMTDLSATVRYVLIEPMETDLTAEQLEAYKALTSNYPTTTILNDENAHVEATLVADTKNHIEQNYVPLESYKSLEARVLAVEQALA